MTFRDRLRFTVDSQSTRSGILFDRGIQLLIVASLIAFCIDTLPDLPSGVRKSLLYFELVSISIFSIEYLLRLYVSEPRLRYPLSFFGIIDLIAILPFILGIALDLRSLRAVRLFRLIRVLKLIRYSKAAQRFQRSFHLIREELILFGAACLLLIFFASVGIYYFENPAQPEAFTSVFHCMWWAVSTLTTVGYGDVYPVTVGGRLFTTFVLFIGLGTVAVPAGLFAGALSKDIEEVG